MGVPNFHNYHQVAQLTLYHATEVPLWVGLEAIDLIPVWVSNILWVHRKDHKPEVTQHSLQWDKLNGPFKRMFPRCPLVSFYYHPAFFSRLLQTSLVSVVELPRLNTFT